MLFSNQHTKKVESHFKDYEVTDFPKVGMKAAYTVFLPVGNKALESYSHALEPYFRKLGLPTKLSKQQIELLADTYVCKGDEDLTVEQCKLLKLLGHKMSKFSFQIVARREKSGKFVNYIK